MAIGTNDTIHKFGTQTEVTVAAPAQINNGAFSAASDVDDWTNTDDAPMASFVLILEDVSTGTPAAGDVINLYCKPLNIADTTGDHFGPSTNVPTHYLGSFLIDASDPAASADYYTLGPVMLPNVKSQQEYEFYIENALSNSTVIDANDWELWITPVTFGPSS